MPSTSKKQHNFMAAIAKNPAFAKKVGIKQAVGEEFLNADKGKKFKKDGMMKKTRKYAEGGEMIDANETEGGAYVGSRLNMPSNTRLGKLSPEDTRLLNKQDAVSGMNKNPKMGGLARAGMSAGLGSKYGMKKGGMAKSDMKEDMKMDKKQDVAMIKKAFKEHDAQEHKGGKGTKLKLKKGGSVKGCGIASKGLTKGKIV